MKLSDRQLYIIITTFGLLLVMGNILRIMNVTITHDEAYTFDFYLSGSFKDIWHSRFPTANNHLLNSVLTKTFISLFGNDIFFLRLASLLAQVVYIVYGFLLSRLLFKNNKWVIVAFVLLSLNSYLFEFWGLCRGYGLSIALMMAALWHLFRFGGIRLTHLFIASAYAVLAVYAGFALLNFYLSFLFIAVVLAWQDYKKLIATIATLTVVSALLYALIAEHIRILIEKHEFYYGGESGFVQDTIYSLLESSFNIETGSSQQVIAYTIVAGFLMSGIYWLIAIAKARLHALTGILLWCAVFIPAISTVLQHYILGNKFLLGRTALFFYPLLILQLVYVLYFIAGKNAARALPVIIALPVAAIILFIARFNFSKTTDWAYDRYDKVAVERIASLKLQDTSSTILINAKFIPSFLYYNNTQYSGRLYTIDKLEETPYENRQYDFIYFTNQGPHGTVIEKLSGTYVQDTVFHDINTYLYKQIK